MILIADGITLWWCFIPAVGFSISWTGKLIEARSSSVVECPAHDGSIEDHSNS